MPLKEAPIVPEPRTKRGRGSGTWQIRWWAILAIAGLLIMVTIPSVVRAVEDHQGSRPALSADPQREIVVDLSWRSSDDPLYPRLPNAELTYRTLDTRPELAHSLVEWTLPQNYMFAGVGSPDLRADPGTLIAVVGAVDRVQVYFVTSIHGTGEKVAQVDLHDGVGRLPNLHGTYTMVILGRWQPGTAAFTQTVHFGS